MPPAAAATVAAANIVKEAATLVSEVSDITDNAKEPDEPFYTMEVKPRYNSVVQLHGFNNSYPNPKTDKALISFVKKWAANKKIAY